MKTLNQKMTKRKRKLFSTLIISLNKSNSYFRFDYVRSFCFIYRIYAVEFLYAKFTFAKFIFLECGEERARNKILKMCGKIVNFGKFRNLFSLEYYS